MANLNNQFNWTKELKKIAHDAILADYNNYELKPVKFLKSILYLQDGRARKIGNAHDYTFVATQI